MAETTNRIDSKLEAVLPPFAADIWTAFNSMSRPPSMGGISKISQQEIAAYQHNYAIRFNQFELDMIDMIDQIAIEVFSKKG